MSFDNEKSLHQFLTQEAFLEFLKQVELEMPTPPTSLEVALKEGNNKKVRNILFKRNSLDLRSAFETLFDLEVSCERIIDIFSDEIEYSKIFYEISSLSLYAKIDNERLFEAILFHAGHLYTYEFAILSCSAIISSKNK